MAHLVEGVAGIKTQTTLDYALFQTFNVRMGAALDSTAVPMITAKLIGIGS
jgi:hypothetical protein